MALAVLVALTAFGRSAVAEEVEVPASLQAQFLSKVASYDRSFHERVRDRVRIMVVSKPRSLQSLRATGFIQSALSQQSDIGGLPHEVQLTKFTTAPALAADCKARAIAIVYLTPGLDAELESIVAALSPLQLMTVSFVADYVPHGAMLGFKVVAGRPKILIHLRQSRKQGVRFTSDLLRLAKVYD